MWEHFIDHICIGDLLLPIYRDVSVVNNFKGVRPPFALVAWYISSFSKPLAQAVQFIGVQRIPDILLFGMFPQLSVFERLSCFFIKYGNVPVKDKLARVTPS